VYFLFKINHYILPKPNRTKMENKIKKIIPRKLFIQTKYNYQNFRKKGYKVLSKVEIDKEDNRYSNSRGPTLHIESIKLLKLFKALKYVPKLDLSKLKLCDRASYLSKVLYFVKRNSKAKNIKVHDIKMANENYKGVSEVWAKYSQAVQVLGYSFDYRMLLGSRHVQDEDTPKNFSAFIRLLKYQPCVKDLTFQFPAGHSSLGKGFYEFEKYPETLERLSLKEVDCGYLEASSLNHLKNLKHLEIEFNKTSTGNLFAHAFELIPKTSSHLQSLSLSWPENNIPFVSSGLHQKRDLNYLQKLKLDLNLTDSFEFEEISKTFEKCPLKHLTLLLQVESQKQLYSLPDFLKGFKCLQYLKLKIHCKAAFDNMKMLQGLFREIDLLPLLKKLSISLTSNAKEEDQLLQEQDQIFTKIFTKTVPLVSFKIELRAISLSHQGFLNLIKSLDPLKTTLNKLRIDVGRVDLDAAEFEMVSDFLKELKNIRCLRFESLNIPDKQFFQDLTHVISQMKYLRTLTIGQIQEKVPEEAIISIVKNILEKNGLRKFDCSVSHKFEDILGKILLAEVKKRNPSLIKTPKIPIFASVYDNNKW